ncbi:kinase-like domain-containing protein [Tanacetum coccineum]|uniref:Kinase-like domain-containing protein n=1 Tax=Tanacetum coccineum TaxID=301880 RepID=A0ABQ5EAH9_9ASTR
MSSPNQNLKHLKIPLEDKLEATNHFSNENFIRQGGFGKIYKGKFKRSGELMIDIVARRLDTKYGQGSKDFWTEILMLSKLEHKNLVSLVGFCDEKKEKIVINKYEANGSLDNCIMTTLTMGKRLQMCVHLEGMDIVDDACGSTGYVDPTYVKTGTVTHKSDIYSFGVVLFEVLLGEKAITDNRDIQLAQAAKSRYEC